MELVNLGNTRLGDEIIRWACDGRRVGAALLGLHFRKPFSLDTCCAQMLGVLGSGLVVIAIISAHTEALNTAKWTPVPSSPSASVLGLDIASGPLHDGGFWVLGSSASAINQTQWGVPHHAVWHFNAKALKEEPEHVWEEGWTKTAPHLDGACSCYFQSTNRSLILGGRRFKDPRTCSSDLAEFYWYGLNGNLARELPAGTSVPLARHNHECLCLDKQPRPLVVSVGGIDECDNNFSAPQVQRKLNKFEIWLLQTQPRLREHQWFRIDIPPSFQRQRRDFMVIPLTPSDAITEGSEYIEFVVAGGTWVDPFQNHSLGRGGDMHGQHGGLDQTLSGDSPPPPLFVRIQLDEDSVPTNVSVTSIDPARLPRPFPGTQSAPSKVVCVSLYAPQLYRTVCHVAEKSQTQELYVDPRHALEVEGGVSSQLYVFKSRKNLGVDGLESSTIGLSGQAHIPRDIQTLVFSFPVDVSPSELYINIVDVKGQVWRSDALPFDFFEDPLSVQVRPRVRTSADSPASRIDPVVCPLHQDGAKAKPDTAVTDESSNAPFILYYGGSMVSPAFQPEELKLVRRFALYDTWMFIPHRLEWVLVDAGNSKTHSPRISMSVKLVSITDDDGNAVPFLTGFSEAVKLETWMMDMVDMKWQNVSVDWFSQHCQLTGGIIHSSPGRKNGFFCTNSNSSILFIDLKKHSCEKWLDVPTTSSLSDLKCHNDLCALYEPGHVTVVIDLRERHAVRIVGGYRLLFLGLSDDFIFASVTTTTCSQLSIKDAFAHPNTTTWASIDCALQSGVGFQPTAVIGSRLWNFEAGTSTSGLSLNYLRRLPSGSISLQGCVTRSLHPPPLRYPSVATVFSTVLSTRVLLLGGVDPVGNTNSVAWFVETEYSRAYRARIDNFNRFGHFVGKANDTTFLTHGGLRCRLDQCAGTPDMTAIEYRYGGPTEISDSKSWGDRYEGDEFPYSDAIDIEPEARMFSCSTTLSEGEPSERHFVLFGGVTFNATSTHVWDDVWVNQERMKHAWVNATHMLSTLPPRPVGRFGATCGGVERYMYVYGGIASNFTILGDLWRFDSDMIEWYSLSQLDSERPKPLAFGLMEIVRVEPDNSVTLVVVGGREPARDEAEYSGISEPKTATAEPWLENTRPTNAIWIYSDNTWLLWSQTSVEVDATSAISSQKRHTKGGFGKPALELNRTDKFATNFAILAIQINCPPGTRGWMWSTPCTKCARGYYSTGTDNARCEQCPRNAMTAGTGSSSLSECSVCADGLCSGAGTRNCTVDPKTGWFQCSCGEDWLGPNCDARCPTYGNITCAGQGECVYQEKSRVAVCSCSDGFFDRDCSRSCPRGPGEHVCSGHGTCDDGSAGRGGCQCDRGFFGLACQDECPGGSERPCALKGSCDDGSEGSGVCTCEEPFRGVACDQCPPDMWGGECRFACDGFDGRYTSCSGHGSCSDGPMGSGRCACSGGYAGQGCHLACPGVEQDAVCSGHGSCDDGASGAATCSCTWMWVGSNCQFNWMWVAGPLAGILVGALVFYFVREKLSSFQEQTHNFLTLQRRLSEMGVAIRNRESEWELREEDFEDKEVIGSGASAQVIRTYWKSAGKIVAKKKYFDARHTMQFSEEMAILKTLRHPNVVMMWGACKKPPFLVMELLARKSLHEAMLVNGEEFTWDRRIGVALDIARGMEYLHTRQPPVYHRDLTTHNVFLSKDWTAKVGDFGISKRKRDALHHPESMTPATTGVEGDLYIDGCTNIAYAAPEVVAKGESNAKGNNSSVIISHSHSHSNSNNGNNNVGNNNNNNDDDSNNSNNNSSDNSEEWGLQTPLLSRKRDVEASPGMELTSAENVDVVAAASDVYSFGMVLYGLCTTGVEPWDQYDAAEIVAAVMNQRRPLIPKTTLPDVTDLIRTCWAHNWQDRPQFAKIRNALEAILSKLRPHGEESDLSPQHRLLVPG